MQHNTHNPFQKKFLGITTSTIELRDLVKAWIVISLAFTILHTGLSLKPVVIIVFIVSALTVGTGFLLHELAHKIVAQKFKCWAEFRAFDLMLLIAIVSSFFGFIFAAPGAVMIRGHITKERHGLIALAGPLTNYLLAGLYFFLVLSPIKLLVFIGTMGFSINVWLGLFNLIPLWNLDGLKILEGNKVHYGIMVLLGIALMGLKYVYHL